MSDRPDWMTELPAEEKRPNGSRILWGAVRAAALFLLLGGLLLAVLDGLMFFGVIYTIGVGTGKYGFRGEEYSVFALSVIALVLGGWLQIAYRRRRLSLSSDNSPRWTRRAPLLLTASAIVTYMSWHALDYWVFLAVDASVTLTVALLSPYWLPFVFIGYCFGRRKIEPHAVLLFFLAETLALLWVAWYSNWNTPWALQIEPYYY
jgi:hypothetical protein